MMEIPDSDESFVSSLSDEEASPSQAASLCAPAVTPSRAPHQDTQAPSSAAVQSRRNVTKDPIPIPSERVEAIKCQTPTPRESSPSSIVLLSSSPATEEATPAATKQSKIYASATPTAAELGIGTEETVVSAAAVEAVAAETPQKGNVSEPPGRSSSNATKPPPLLSSSSSRTAVLEATLADLIAQRDALLQNFSTLPEINARLNQQQQNHLKKLSASADEPMLSAKHVDGSAADAYVEPSASNEAAVVLDVANVIIQRHIKLLHAYNEIRDVGQGLMGLIAEGRGVRIRDVQEDFGIDAND